MSKNKARPRRYWLFKSEPTTYGFAQFAKDRRTSWSGVRNFQARNLLRDEVAVDDGVLFYHSSAEPTEIAGIARVVKAGYPDPTQFDATSDYHDQGSDPEAPKWFQVDIECRGAMRSPVTREQCKMHPALQSMLLLKKGSRLSVQPVTESEWNAILAMGGQKEDW